MMDERQKFVIQAAKEREERIALQGAANVVVQLQAAIRGFIARKKFIQCFENDFDIKFGLIYSEQTLVPTNVQLLNYGILLCRFLKESENIVRYGAFCRQLAQSLFSADEKITFAALLADPIQSNFATTLIRKIHTKVPSILAIVDLDKVTHHKSATAIVTYLVLLSSPTLWALTKTKNELGSTMQNCCASYSLGLLEISSLEHLSTFLNNCLKRVKPTQFSDFINNIVTVLHRVVKTCFSNIGVQSTNITIKYLYTCPGLLSLLNKNAMGLVKDAKTFENILKFFNKNSQILDDFSVLQTLNLLANIIFLSNVEHDLLVENVFEWTHVVNSFFTRFQSALSGNKSKPFAHPVLGFISERIGPNDDSINNTVKDQLQNFWSKKMVSCLFGKVLGSVEGTNTKKLASQGDSLSTDLINRLKKLMVKEQPDYTMNLGPVSLTAVVCQLYQNAILTFQKLHDDIVRGLCFDNSILKQLWAFICTNSPKGPTHYLLSLFSADPTGNLPHFSPFSLFAHTAYSQISSLDEQEMYEEGIPFSIQQLCDIAYFTNVFCFKAIWENILDFEQPKAESLFSSLYKLCMLLHNRDARRSFISDKHFWLAPDLKSSAIISEFEKKTRKGSKLMSMMPHLVHLKERMILFRRLVNLDKKEAEKRNGLTTLVTIGRNSLVEDGYRQLSQMSSEELKAGFRIKFVNQQGLDEAGIDQDGVFKEFLELTVKGIFNPELNLFKMTINGQFYPSNTSNIHENHLEYFHHIGRMLGKAVYDGFVVDIQLAPVLLATILKKRLYALDELAQVDPDMYKNLTYIKKYKESEDVADLELTFSVDEEFLGQVKTVDLPNSGRYMKVTNENRMRYVHEMAIYRVVTRTRAQTESFVLGFRSILNSEWLALFSTHELQSLISGIRTDVDVADLKKNTQYYGGFHSNHRVIKWLWEVVEHEFSAEERGLFLKFVTSCSRAPLLGFSSLEPPFSIRCIETSDDQDPGDTLGSVVRGFLAINKKTKSTARLPTSSTCFNLLKLPNYNKKSLLLEKLRYAIRAQAGFELS